MRRVWLLALAVFLLWVAHLLTVLHNKGVIQFGGSDFQLKAPNVIINTKPVKTYRWNQLEQKRHGPE